MVLTGTPKLPFLSIDPEVLPPQTGSPAFSQLALGVSDLWSVRLLLEAWWEFGDETSFDIRIRFGDGHRDVSRSGGFKKEYNSGAGTGWEMS